MIRFAKKLWSYLPGDTSGYHDNLHAGKSLIEFVRMVAIDLAPRHSAGVGRSEREMPYLSWCVDVADVGGDSRGAADVVQAQGSNERISFEQERERLANSSTRAEDSNFAVTGDRRREPTTVGRKAASGVSGEHFFVLERRRERKDGKPGRGRGMAQPRFVPSPAFSRPSPITGHQWTSKSLIVFALTSRPSSPSFPSMAQISLLLVALSLSLSVCKLLC